MRQVVELMGSNTLKETKVGSPCEEPIILPLPYVDEDRVYKLLNHWIDLAKIKPAAVADVCHALTGRGRIASRFLLSFYSKTCVPSEDSTAFFKRCFADYREWATKADDKPTLFSIACRWISGNYGFSTISIIERLQRLFIDSILSGGHRVLFSDHNDLSSSDLCWLVKCNPEQEHDWAVGEPLLSEAVLEAFKKLNSSPLIERATNAMTTSLSVYGSQYAGKGNGLETLLAAYLISLSGRKLVDLPLLQEIEHVERLQGYVFCFARSERQNGPSGLADFLRHQSADYLLYPSSMAGPDLVGILSVDGSNSMLTCACRLYSKTLTTETLNQNTRTTDIFKCYFRHDGSGPNQRCKTLRRQVLGSLRNFTGCYIRFVLSFPSNSATPRWEQIGPPSAEAWSLVVPINQHNFAKFFALDQQAMKSVITILEILDIDVPNSRALKKALREEKEK